MFVKSISMPKKISLKNNIFLSLITLLILFFIAEISIRTRDVFKGYSFFSNDHRDKMTSKAIIPHRVFGYNLYVEKNNVKYISSRHNELYPLKKSKETYRIVCGGDQLQKMDGHTIKTGLIIR